MIIVDANVLLYAVNADFPRHVIAREYLEQRLIEGRKIGIPWLCVVAFLRISTLPKLFANPLSAREAMSHIEHWFSHPQVSAPEPGKHHLHHWGQLLHAVAGVGNWVNDAHLAAIALERKAELASFDRDFARFPGLRHVVPS